MRMLLLVAGVGLLLYGGYLVLLYIGQREMMFPGAGMSRGDALRELPDYARAVDIEASYGTVQGILLRPPARQAAPTPAPALLYFHGNAELAVHNVQLLRPLLGLGMHVLLVEYPGYDGADGVPGRDTLAIAARRSYEWLAQDRHVDASRIVAMGRSVGAGPAVELAAERDVAALVLLSAFSSVGALARGMGAPPFLVRDPYDNRALLGEYQRPVLLFHGRHDTIIPFAHAQALQQAAARAQLVALACGHNDCPYFDAEFLATLEGFLREAGILDVHPGQPTSGLRSAGRKGMDVAPRRTRGGRSPGPGSPVPAS